MENEFRVIDVILSVILVVVMSVGIGIYVVKRANYPRELTTDNYNEHLRIYANYQHSDNLTDYIIVFESRSKFKVKNGNAEIRIKGKSINSQTLTVSFSASRGNPYKYKIALDTQKPPSYYYDTLLGWYDIDVEVVSISGQLSRG